MIFTIQRVKDVYGGVDKKRPPTPDAIWNKDCWIIGLYSLDDLKKLAEVTSSQLIIDFDPDPEITIYDDYIE